MKTAKQIAEEIFYKPATNGKSGKSILEGEVLIKEYSKEALKEAAEIHDEHDCICGGVSKKIKSSILNIELK